ncbi:zinc finger protein 431-like [Littorina saxatilis]|uniref:zinc finger protein 431-like n=1 Tax=Littorina saxatilis TaxID=31220 RepID=UPI0038B459EB
MEVCSICSKHFNLSSIANTNTHSHPHTVTDAEKTKMCSELCRWVFQYILGFAHGFLLCDTVRILTENQAHAGFENTSAAPMPLRHPQKEDTDTEGVKNSQLEPRVKAEKAPSDVEDFDCTVSFQGDAQYDDSTDINEDIADAWSVHREGKNSVASGKKVSRKEADHVVRTKKTDVHKQIKINRDQRAINPKAAQSVKQTRQRKSLRNARKSVMKQEQNLKGVKRKQEKKNSVSNSRKQKIAKLAKRSEAEKNLENTDDEAKLGSAIKCEFCSKPFNAKRFLQRHLNRFHPEEITVCCEVCGELCKNETYLNVHMRREHSLQGMEGEELYHCDQCPKSFNASRGLSLHKEFVHSHENPVNCKLCDLTLKNEIYLKRHMKRSHSDSIICDICGAKFKSRLGLNAHLSAHKGVKSFFCEVCGMGFVRKTSLRRHVQQHSDESYDCDSCSSSYKTFGSLSLHMLQIHQRGTYFENRLKSMEKLGCVVNKEAIQRHRNRQCVTCGETLVAGICVTHPTEYALMFKCHLCELTADHVDDLLAHLKDHNDGTSSSSISVSFGCKVCRKVFPRKLYLNQHMKKHHPGASMSTLSMSEATLSYVCHVCGKHFQQKQYLYVHMKQHLQPRSFACSICDKKFTYKCNLKNHLTTHSEEKPFQCDVCFKLFRRKEVLNSHRLVHNPSLSPFKCHICGKGLSRKQYLKKHYQIMHPETQEGGGPLKAQSQLAPPEQLQQLEQPHLQQLSLPLPQIHNTEQFTSL